MNKNLVIRILVAAIFIPVILWICYQGGWWLLGMVMFFALTAMIEFLYNEKYRPNQFLFWMALLTVITALIVTNNQMISILVYWDIFVVVFSINMFLLVSGMIFASGKLSPEELFSKYTKLFWGVAYISILYPFVYHTGTLQYNSISGGDWLLLLFGILWIGDTAAMGFGKWIGKNKLAPTVSPNKTVEGFIGGLVGAVIIGIIMYFWKFQTIPFYHIASLAIICSIFGQLGDLVESMWKRSIGIKDSSAVIPGHGGMLDRFDSLLFASPVMYFYITLFL
jgi:phosphatidate cytidylyltransferase